MFELKMIGYYMRTNITNLLLINVKTLILYNETNTDLII